MEKLNNIEGQLDNSYSFETQFNSPKTIKVDNFWTKYIDLEASNEEAHHLPVVLVPGWGLGYSAYKDTIDTFHNKDFRVLLMDFPRGNKVHDFHEKEGHEHGSIHTKRNVEQGDGMTTFIAEELDKMSGE